MAAVLLFVAPLSTASDGPDVTLETGAVTEGDLALERHYADIGLSDSTGPARSPRWDSSPWTGPGKKAVLIFTDPETRVTIRRTLYSLDNGLRAINMTILIPKDLVPAIALGRQGVKLIMECLDENGNPVSGRGINMIETRIYQWHSNTITYSYDTSSGQSLFDSNFIYSASQPEIVTLRMKIQPYGRKRTVLGGYKPEGDPVELGSFSCVGYVEARKEACEYLDGGRFCD